MAIQQKKSNHEIRSRIEEDLRAAFPGKIQFDFAEAALAIGCSAGHISNLESSRQPLFPSVRVGRKRLVQFHDIVDFLVAQRLRAQVKRGAPTKAERLARLASQQGGEK